MEAWTGTADAPSEAPSINGDLLFSGLYSSFGQKSRNLRVLAQCWPSVNVGPVGVWEISSEETRKSPSEGIFNTTKKPMCWPSSSAGPTRAGPTRLGQIVPTLAFHCFHCVTGWLWAQAVAFASITQDDGVVLLALQSPHIVSGHDETHHKQLLSALHDFVSEYLPRHASSRWGASW